MHGGGGQGRNRTADTRIFSPLLYRLSYLAGCLFLGIQRECKMKIIGEGRAKTRDGRGGEIRTHDLLLPKQARYQAAPRPDGLGSGGK